jgi:hypothetical protein
MHCAGRTISLSTFSNQDDNLRFLPTMICQHNWRLKIMGEDSLPAYIGLYDDQFKEPGE